MAGPGNTPKRRAIDATVLDATVQGKLFTDPRELKHNAAVIADTPSLNGCFDLSAQALASTNQVPAKKDRTDRAGELRPKDDRIHGAAIHLVNGALESYRAITYTILNSIAVLEEKQKAANQNGKEAESKALTRTCNKLRELNGQLDRLCHVDGEFIPPPSSQLSDLIQNGLPIEKKFLETRLKRFRYSGGLATTVEDELKDEQRRVRSNPGPINQKFNEALAALGHPNLTNISGSNFETDRELVLDQTNLISVAKQLSPRALVRSLISELGEYGRLYNLTATGNSPLVPLEDVAKNLIEFRFDNPYPAHGGNPDKYLNRIYCESPFRPDYIGSFFRDLAGESPLKFLVRQVKSDGRLGAPPRWDDLAEGIIPESDPGREELISKIHDATKWSLREQKYEYYSDVKNRLFEQSRKYFLSSSSPETPKSGLTL
jgi:hypothetical protein